MDNQQPKVTDIEFGWVCGMFDGEGTAALLIRHHRNKRDNCTPLWAISGTDTPAVNHLTAILERAKIPHHVGWWQPRGYSKKGTAYRKAWTVTGSGLLRGSKFYPWILPGLYTKRERAQLVWEFICSRLNQPRMAPLTAHELDIALAVRRLNAKGQPEPGILPETGPRPPLTDAQRQERSESGKKGAEARWGDRALGSTTAR